MSRSYSSLLRSMPVYQPQLNMTAFRSFAPDAGVKGGAPRPRPRPWPWPSPAGALAPGPGPAPACAPAMDGTPMVSAAANATLVQMRVLRKVMIIPLRRLVGGCAGKNRDSSPVRQGYGFEETQRAAVHRG